MKKIVQIVICTNTGTGKQAEKPKNTYKTFTISVKVLYVFYEKEDLFFKIFPDVAKAAEAKKGSDATAGIGTGNGLSIILIK